jgi:hypothetical protein
MLEPLDVNFYYRNNKVVIHQLRTRIERESCRDHSYAELDFDTQDIASQAVIVANDAKNLILTFTDYYNTGEIDEMFSNISLNDLDDVNTDGTINGYYLSYSGGTWIGVPDSTDLSNYLLNLKFIILDKQIFYFKTTTQVVKRMKFLKIIIQVEKQMKF